MLYSYAYIQLGDRYFVFSTNAEAVVFELQLVHREVPIRSSRPSDAVPQLAIKDQFSYFGDGNIALPPHSMEAKVLFYLCDCTYYDDYSIFYVPGMLHQYCIHDSRFILINDGERYLIIFTQFH